MQVQEMREKIFPFQKNKPINQVISHRKRIREAISRRNPDSSPPKRQSDRSYLPNQALRHRPRTLSAAAPFPPPPDDDLLIRGSYSLRAAPLSWVAFIIGRLWPFYHIVSPLSSIPDKILWKIYRIRRLSCTQKRVPSSILWRKKRCPRHKLRLFPMPPCRREQRPPLSGGSRNVSLSFFTASHSRMHKFIPK